MRHDLRPAFYTLQGSIPRDCVSLLHVPYTLWILAYVCLGAAMAPVLHLDRTAGVLLAFFLAVGLGAHALDELRGRPLRTQVPRLVLIAVGAGSIAGAIAMGALAALLISMWVVPFVLFGGFIVVAYNLELWKGRFHSDGWFALAWGAFPPLVGYWANAEQVTVGALGIAAACFVISMVQRVLSTHVRDIRRRARSVHGIVDYEDGSSTEISPEYLLRPSETALRLLTLGVILIAAGALLVRL